MTNFEFAPEYYNEEILLELRPEFYAFEGVQELIVEAEENIDFYKKKLDKKKAKLEALNTEMEELKFYYGHEIKKLQAYEALKLKLIKEEENND